jgi:hypothetical protein
MAAVSPYETALALGRPKPTHVEDGVENIDRITAYSTYEDIWNNVPEAFDKLLRSGDDPKSRRYVPLVRGLIEGINRYLGQDPEIVWTPMAGATVSQDQMDVFTNAIDTTLIREEFAIKFLALKRWTLIKGDGILMLSADPSKPEGTRIRLIEVEPDQYFPIYDSGDGERVIGCYLASIVQNDDDEDIVQRIEYQRVNNADRAGEFAAPLGSVFYRIGYYELDGWDDRAPDGELKETDAPSWAAPAEGAPDPFAGYALPAQITSIPVYHFRNARRGGIVGRFGTSEIQGLETVLSGLIQNATDEDLSVALMGIGMYWTDSGQPHDDQGRVVPWDVAPGTILELEKDGRIGRLDGITSVQPIQDHMTFLKSSAREAAAVPDVAAGRIDSQTAQSGVALRVEFMPVIAKNMEKEAELSSRLMQMLFDLATMWFPAYEGLTPPLVQPSLVFGDPLPLDRAAALKEILDMVTAKVVSIQWAQKAIADRLGYKFDANMLAEIVSEEQQLLDATGQRITDDAAPAADTSQDA